MFRTIIAGVIGSLLLEPVALATTCPAFSYSFTNGTVADATQVMSDFNTLMTCANSSLAPIISPVFTGAVGVGTSNILGTLTVSGGTDRLLNVRGDPATFGFPSGLLGPILQGTNSAQSAFEPITLSGSSINLMNGNVGIQTTSPGYPLDIGTGAAQSLLRLNGGNSGAGVGAAILLSNAGALNTAIGNVSAIYGSAFSSDLALYTAGSNVVIPNGFVGIGTTTPTANLDIENSTSNWVKYGSSGYIVQQYYTSGSAADQKYWDMVAGGGAIVFRAVNDAYSASNTWMQVSRGSGDSISNVFFPNGNVGIGTIPGYALDVVPSTGPTVMRVNGRAGATSDNVQLRFAGQKDGELWALGSDIVSGGSTKDFEFYSLSASATEMMISPTGNVGIGTTSPSYLLHVNGTAYATGAAGALSDIRHKKAVESLKEGALDDIMKLRPVSFFWKDPKDDGMKGEQMGFIAQEVEKVLPTVVLTQSDSDKTKGLKYNEVVAVLTKAVQEQQAEIGKLKAANDAYAAKLERLESSDRRHEASFDALERRIDALQRKANSTRIVEAASR